MNYKIVIIIHIFFLYIVSFVTLILSNNFSMLKIDVKNIINLSIVITILYLISFIIPLKIISSVTNFEFWLLNLAQSIIFIFANTLIFKKLTGINTLKSIFISLLVFSMLQLVNWGILNTFFRITN